MAKQAKKKPPLAERVAKLEHFMEVFQSTVDEAFGEGERANNQMAALRKHVDDGFQAHRESVCGQTSGHKWIAGGVANDGETITGFGFTCCVCDAKVVRRADCLSRRERRQVRKALGL